MHKRPQSLRFASVSVFLESEDYLRLVVVVVAVVVIIHELLVNSGSSLLIN